MTGAYYNEKDEYAAQWLRNLIAAGHVAPGEVDERSIVDVVPDEIRGFRQVHFFAGIGIWSLSLRRAGWSDSRSVWSGSCPCQPFSAAGKRAGIADERHLWPAFYHLISVCKPDLVLGEQVASRDGLGWLEGVQADLEAAGYAVGAVDTCAAGFRSEQGVEGFHIRQRIYWAAQRLANADDARPQGRGQRGNGADERAIGPRGVAGGMADANGRYAGAEREQPSRQHGLVAANNGVDWLLCSDGKYRPVESGTFPLAHADPQRVGRLRAYGNALDLAQAQGFVEAVMACQP